MQGEPIPDADHVARYCPKRCVDGERITGAAFQLRPATEKRAAERYLSVNWLEYLQLDDRDKEIVAIRKILSGKLTAKKNDRIAIGNAGEVRNNVRSYSGDNRELSILHEPDYKNDPSHAGIYGLSVNDDLLYGELIAQVCQESYPAKEG